MRRLLLAVCGIGSLLLLACGEEKLQYADIYVTADAEGFYSPHVEQNQTIGGYGVLKKFVEALESPFLLFDGGNWLGTVPENALTEGAFITPFLKEIPYTAATLSESDFMHGWPSLRSTVREMPYPFVVSNLRLENTLPWPLHDYQIRTIGPLKIGIFGVMQANQSASKDARLMGINVLDPLQTAQEMTALLKEKQVDYIIVLSALGEPKENGISDSTLAQEVEGINLILSSNKDRQQAESEQIGNTLLVYPGAHLERIGHVRIFFDKTKQIHQTDFEDILLLKEKYGEDEALGTRAAVLRKETGEKMNKRVTSAAQEIVTYEQRESPLGALLSECLYKWSKLDGAVLNGGSIRSNLPKGEIREYDVYKMYPYGDNITFVTLKGAALTQALQNSMNAENNFPQVAGLQIEYTSTPVGKKIKKIVLANGRIVRPNETYRIAVTDHILAGGFGHDSFINALEFKNTFVEARQIMRACLIKQKQIALPSSSHFKEVK